MAFAAARMILKDKRRKSKEDFPTPRNRSKARSSASTSSFQSANQARNKPADGGHVNQKGQSGAKATPTGQQNKQGQKSAPKPPTAQKGQVKAAQPKAAAVKAGAGKQQQKKKKNQYDLVVTIDLVVLSPIQETEGGQGNAGTAALAQAVLSPALTSAGLSQMSLPTSVALTPVTVGNQSFLAPFVFPATPSGSPSPTRANFSVNVQRKATPPHTFTLTPVIDSTSPTITEVPSIDITDMDGGPGSNASSITSQSSAGTSTSTVSTLPMTDAGSSRKVSVNSMASTTSKTDKKEVYV